MFSRKKKKTLKGPIKDKSFLNNMSNLIEEQAKAPNPGSIKRPKKNVHEHAPSQTMERPEGVVTQGWMDKKGAVNLSWKRRYFVMTESSDGVSLIYFKNKESNWPLGSMDLNSQAQVDSYKKLQHEYGIVLIHEETVWILGLGDQKLQLEWLKHIQKYAKKTSLELPEHFQESRIPKTRNRLNSRRHSAPISDLISDTVSLCLCGPKGCTCSFTYTRDRKQSHYRSKSKPVRKSRETEYKLPHISIQEMSALGFACKDCRCTAFRPDKWRPHICMDCRHSKTAHSSDEELEQKLATTRSRQPSRIGDPRRLNLSTSRRNFARQIGRVLTSPPSSPRSRSINRQQEPVKIMHISAPEVLPQLAKQIEEKIDSVLISLHNKQRQFDPEKKMSDEEHRERLTDEIRTTEITYLKGLSTLIIHFVDPLEAARKRGAQIITREQSQMIFANITQIAQFHSYLLSDLNDKALIPEIFTRMADFLKLYTHYVNTYDKCLDTISKLRRNQQFQEFVEEKRQDDGIDLMSHLILPIQRIPRYKMLLEQLKKYTSEDHDQYKSISRAVIKLGEVADHVNESKRHFENMANMLQIQARIKGQFDSLIQPDRRLISEGLVTQKLPALFGDGLYARRVYLFSDMIMWVTKNQRYKGSMYFKEMHPTKFRIQASSDSKSSFVGFSLQKLKSSGAPLLFICKDDTEAEKWLKDISDVVKLSKDNAPKWEEFIQSIEEQ